MPERQSLLQESCCQMMADNLKATCGAHGDACPDLVVRRLDDGTIGISIHDGGGSVIEIAYCPWCGSPIVSNDEWFGDGPYHPARTSGMA